MEAWTEGIRGTQVLPLINSDATTIRVEAGPGTGKTFGLVRRVQRILHPQGLGLPGREVLVIAFNRVIAKELKAEIASRLAESPHDGDPIVETVHALCLRVIGSEPRILLPHEREAMLYDVLEALPSLRQTCGGFASVDQALKEHEARRADYPDLWQAVQRWLTRHQATLISDLPSLLLDRLKRADRRLRVYRHVIVDEFQDLTLGEQLLFLRLRAPGGSLVALGDPRQSIYAFRGNDRQGLANLNSLLGEGHDVSDLPMTQCNRCPRQIVEAANRLMGPYESQQLVSASEVTANTHVVKWDSPNREAEGMAAAILASVRAHRGQRHLVIVTHRSFGYMLRDKLAALDSDLQIDLSFSESLLEKWPVREAFLFFCLIVDPDPPTWRAWLGYQTPAENRPFKAPTRNADAYLRLLSASRDSITENVVQRVASASAKPPGAGGSTVWQRARRFMELKHAMGWNGEGANAYLALVFSAARWIEAADSEAETARLDMQLALKKATGLLEDDRSERRAPLVRLAEVAKRLRYQIATKEPFAADLAPDLEVATMWGAKGVTADHVYVLGLCAEAIPGVRRPEYPGTDEDFRDEQRRLFYVSLTRCKSTLVLSRPQSIWCTEAKRLGFSVPSGSSSDVDLAICPFLHEVLPGLPAEVYGEYWPGCT